MFKTRTDKSIILSRRARWVMWGFVLLVSITSFAMDTWIRNQRAADQMAWMARRKQLHLAADAALQKVKSFRTPNQGADEFRPRLSELEQALNGGRPFALHPQKSEEPGRTAYLWNDPASGREFRFTLDSFGHFGYSSNWPSGPLYSWALPAPPPPAAAFESLRRAFIAWVSGIGVGSAAWCGVFLIFLFTTRYRPALSEVLLALAALCTVAWIVNPYFGISFRGIFSNDMLVIAGLMLLASAIMFLGTRQRDRHRPNLGVCSKCEYDLTGNVSGVCPECGMEIPARVRNYIA